LTPACSNATFSSSNCGSDGPTRSTRALMIFSYSSLSGLLMPTTPFYQFGWRSFLQAIHVTNDDIVSAELAG
jgi:hypothetical protein